jgi:hypothetical protein
MNIQSIYLIWGSGEEVWAEAAAVMIEEAGF